MEEKRLSWDDPELLKFAQDIRDLTNPKIEQDECANAQAVSCLLDKTYGE
jgi:hypothetical protein